MLQKLEGKTHFFQCLKTRELRLRGLLLPRNMVSRLGQQFATQHITTDYFHSKGQSHEMDQACVDMISCMLN